MDVVRCCTINIVKYCQILSYIFQCHQIFFNLFKYSLILSNVISWTIRYHKYLMILLNIVTFGCQVVSNIVKYCVSKVFQTCFMGFILNSYMWQLAAASGLIGIFTSLSTCSLLIIVSFSQSLATWSKSSLSGTNSINKIGLNLDFAVILLSMTL